ncbi:Plug domain-containing protein [Massilia sp. H-1]|nr:Plug domain-containing protein [Massilia sp. H-1]
MQANHHGRCRRTGTGRTVCSGAGQHRQPGRPGGRHRHQSGSVDSETASPVQVVTRKEIEQSGAQTVAEILGNVASNDHGAISDLGGTNSWASGASGVSLRNLGATATLVLLNGRRLSSYGFADGLQANFVNIDAIPSEVIERVEILKDGASAIYGSDAIA